MLILALVLGCEDRKPSRKTLPPPKVTVAKPLFEPVQNYSIYNGYLEAVQKVEVVARVPGVIQKVYFDENDRLTEGDIVQKGTLLFELDPREYLSRLNKARADLKRANSQLSRTQRERERGEELRRNNAISEEEFNRLLAEERASLAFVDQAQASVELAELELSFTKIRAPITGRVGEIVKTVENLVGVNGPTVLTTIVSMDPIYVYFDVPERRIIEYDRRVKAEGLPTETQGVIPIAVAVEGEKGFPHSGAIDFRDIRVDSTTGTIRLRGRLPNPDGLLQPGMFAQVRVPLGKEEKRLLVPESALLTDQRGPYLYVVKDDATVEYRPVKLAGRKGTYAAIAEGIQADDWVIINGLQRARPRITVVPRRTELASPKVETTEALPMPKAMVPGMEPRSSPNPQSANGS